MTAPAGLEFLAALRDAVATPEGARLVREIRALLARANITDTDEGSFYAAECVARAFARVEGAEAMREVMGAAVAPAEAESPAPRARRRSTTTR